MAHCGVVDVQISAVKDFAALGLQWRDLEQRANGSFFQSWTWVGCLVAERFADPILVQATEAGRVVALGLFNRVRRRFGAATLYLNEAGSPELDTPYVEHNGILTEAGRETELTEASLRPLAAAFDLVLSGVGRTVVQAAESAAALVHTTRRQPAWFIDLARIRDAGGDYLATCSANTRQQLRRSNRFFEADGPITLQHAESLKSAHAMLDQMAALHQAIWERRGKPGSFAEPWFGRFHHALIEAGFPRGEVTVARISSGENIIGFLYNFTWQKWVSAYQSGFVYRDDENRAKPGLTCHLAAIRDALEQGFEGYDFLAGDDRYKRSLADESNSQFWLEVGPFWSTRLLPKVLVQRIR